MIHKSKPFYDGITVTIMVWYYNNYGYCIMVLQ